MNKKVAAIAAAVVPALLGVVALVSYANNADDRALADVEVAEVLRVTQRIEPLASAADVQAKVEIVKIPKIAIVPGALTNLDQVADLITAGPLVAGDQLTVEKFVLPEQAVGEIKLPKGMQELTIPLSGARVVGGVLVPGDRVGVMASYSGKTANPINQLLLLRVQGAVAEDGTTGEPMLTFAVSTVTAEQLVHAAEFGKLWLTKQNDDTDTKGGKTITTDDVAP